MQYNTSHSHTLGVAIINDIHCPTCHHRPATGVPDTRHQKKNLKETNFVAIHSRNRKRITRNGFGSSAPELTLGSTSRTGFASCWRWRWAGARPAIGARPWDAGTRGRTDKETRERGNPRTKGWRNGEREDEGTTGGQADEAKNEGWRDQRTEDVGTRGREGGWTKGQRTAGTKGRGART